MAGFCSQRWVVDALNLIVVMTALLPDSSAPFGSSLSLLLRQFNGKASNALLDNPADSSGACFNTQCLDELLIGLQTVLDETGSYIFTKDRNGCYTYVNQNVQQLFGLSLADILGKDDSHFFDVEQSQEILQNDKRVLEHGETLHFEERNVIKASGEARIYSIVKKPIYNADKAIVGLCGISTDITARKVLERTLVVNQERLISVLQLVGLGFWELQHSSGEFICSDALFDLFENNDLSFRNGFSDFLALIDAEDQASVNSVYHTSLSQRGAVQIRFRVPLARGLKWMLMSVTSFFDQNGSVLRTLATVQDISAQHQAEEDLRIAAVAFQSQEAMMITDSNATILRVNRAFEHVTGYSGDEVVGLTPRVLKSGHHDAAFYQAMWDSLLKSGVWQGEIWDKHKDGSTYPKYLSITAINHPEGGVSHYVSSFVDISDRKQAEEAIYNLAFYDSLTGLPNRKLLLDRIDGVVKAASQQLSALVFIDLDRFKTLNDTMGHDYGDMLLVEVAQRLKHCLRSHDTVARIGGDEFVVLLPNICATSHELIPTTQAVVEKIRQRIAEPYFLNLFEFNCSASIGMALIDNDAVATDTVIKQADIAMYAAKNAGRNQARFFDYHMQQAVESRAAIERDLFQAISQNQLQLYYQIQVDADMKATGAEALIRWHHPQRGMVSPMQFITVAEESTLILEIGLWVIDSACRQLVAWGRRKKTRHLVLSINISAMQFKQPEFVEQLQDRLTRYGINPKRLKLELTESVVLEDVELVIEKMKALQAIGITLSLDDFGTGYSSLAYLKRLPLNQIKIDKSFVADIVENAIDAAMIKSIIQMAENFGLDVIAEGVETDEQLQLLHRLGALSFQGYLFGKPLPRADFEVLLNGFV